MLIFKNLKTIDSPLSTLTNRVLLLLIRNYFLEFEIKIK